MQNTIFLSLLCRDRKIEYSDDDVENMNDDDDHTTITDNSEDEVTNDFTCYLARITSMISRDEKFPTCFANQNCLKEKLMLPLLLFLAQEAFL